MFWRLARVIVMRDRSTARPAIAASRGRESAATMATLPRVSVRSLLRQDARKKRGDLADCRHGCLLDDSTVALSVVSHIVAARID